jgi:very-short-patch-repair endonuclease
MRDHTPDVLKAAKRLRSAMSLPEVLLWRQIRLRPRGFKFRRQHPVGPYVADFNCDTARTVVEIDGIVHNMGSLPARDTVRDRWMNASGLVVIRISASDVLKDCTAVAESIAAACEAAPPPSALRAATSPEGGGFEGTH